MTDINSEQNSLSMSARIEALLFVAPGSVTAAQLAGALNISEKETEAELKKLEGEYGTGRGLALQWHNGRVQLTSSPNASEAIELFLGLESMARLSRAGLETLTIVAYKQPVTRPTIDSIRGVSSDGVLKSLLSRGLIQEVGRTEGPGRPILYGTTSDFLQHFGLSSLAQLPSYEKEEEIQDKNSLLKD